MPYREGSLSQIPSVPTKMVEGYARKSKKEIFQFISIALNSRAEVEYFFNFSRKLGYCKSIVSTNQRVSIYCTHEEFSGAAMIVQNYCQPKRPGGKYKGARALHHLTKWKFRDKRKSRSDRRDEHLTTYTFKITQILAGKWSVCLSPQFQGTEN